MLKLILATSFGLRWVVVCLTLAGLAIAAPACGQAPASAARLQSLVNDAAMQVRLSYRQDPAERDLRREELGRAIAAWNKSARSEADNERLAEWLRAAMLASMPGSREPLPPVPEFQRPAPPVERASPSAATQNLKSLTKPTATSPTNAGAEPTYAEPSTSSGTTTRSEHVEKGTIDESKEQHEALPTSESTQPGGAKEQSTAGTSQPEIGTRATGEKKPAAVVPSTDDKDGDPFRDDPFPADK